MPGRRPTWASCISTAGAVPLDYAQAVKWFRLAADQGDARAQANLGIMYANGQGVPQDYVQAVKWYRLAADRGDAKAQFNLGGMCASGHGVPQDYAQAAKWFRLAADQGNAGAQYRLGHMYDLGRGVPKDAVEAHKWFNLAAGGASDADTRKRAAKARDAGAGKMSPAQVVEAQKRASAWQPK